MPRQADTQFDQGGISFARTVATYYGYLSGCGQMYWTGCRVRRLIVSQLSLLGVLNSRREKGLTDIGEPLGVCESPSSDLIDTQCG